MKKKLLVLAVAGAFAAPVAAMADATIYGAANVSFDIVSSGSGTTATNGLGAGTTSYNNNQVSSNQSRLGFKGTEDLGGGTSAVWQIESAVNFDSSLNGTSTSAFANRNTFAGLSGESWGTVILGTHDTPYKLASRSLDMFADTIADNRTLMGGKGMTAATVGAILAATAPAAVTAALAAQTASTSSVASFDGRQGNVLAYISPAMSGFTAAVAYVPLNETSTNLNNDKKSAWSLAGLYSAGPLTANLGYEVHDLGQVATATGIKESAWKLGLGYAMDQFAVNAVYEKTTDNLGRIVAAADENFLGHSAYYLAGKFNVSANDAVKLAYTKTGELNMTGGAGKTNTGASQVSLGYDHNMSKRTTVYALYTKLSNQSASAYSLTYSSATTGGIAASGFNASPSAVSLGMKHTF